MSTELPLELILLCFNYLTYSDADKLLKLKDDKITKLIQHHKWDDFTTEIKCNLKTWREKFPNAITVKIHQGNKLKDVDFKYLEGIKKLSIIKQRNITDKAFENLRGIHTLNMSWCDQQTITDKAFEHLQGIHTLNMAWCNQETITDKAFEHLQGIHTLDIAWCNQKTITYKALEQLQEIKILTISNKSPENIYGIKKIYR